MDIQINYDSTKGYKIHGMARAMLGQHGCLMTLVNNGFTTFKKGLNKMT